jgi:hypothetical protein
VTRLAVVAAVDTNLEWRLYLASVAAADGALRANETSAARRWLDEGPSRHRGWEWRCLRARSDESLQAMGAHDAVITDQTVRLWTADSGDPVLTIPFSVQVCGARFSRDGARLAVLPMNGTVVLLDAPSSARRRGVD